MSPSRNLDRFVNLCTIFFFEIFLMGSAHFKQLNINNLSLNFEIFAFTIMKFFSEIISKTWSWACHKSYAILFCLCFYLRLYYTGCTVPLYFLCNDHVCEVYNILLFFFFTYDDFSICYMICSLLLLMVKFLVFCNQLLLLHVLLSLYKSFSYNFYLYNMFIVDTIKLTMHK